MAELDLELLLSLVKGLGSVLTDGKGDKVYSKDEDCLACLKDLQRLLRQDTETREAFQVLGQYNIAKSDLVPMIVTYPKSTDLVYNALKVLTYLTMPIDPASADMPMQAEYMQRVREAFMAKDAMAVIVGLVAEPLGRHPRMTEADGLVVQLVITFFRNLLTIPDRAATAGSGGDHRSKLRQALLTRMFDDNVMELLLVLGQHAHSKPFRTEAPLLMEIFQQVFKSIAATELAEASEPVPQPRGGQHRRGPAVRPHGSAGFKQALQKVTGGGQPSLRKGPGGPPARHARFGGVFVRRYNAEDKGSFVRNSALVADLPGIPELKKTSKAGVEEPPMGQIQAQLLWKLRQYLDQLLQAGSFSTVMASVLQDLKPGLHISRLTREDFLCFFRLANLGTAYVRTQQEEVLKEKQKPKEPKEALDTATSGQPSAAEDKSGNPTTATPQDVSPFACLSSTMGWETFHMVHVLWIGMVDTAGKPAEKDWELQHESLGLLKEMLFALDLALYVGTPSDKRAADRLQRRLLHDDMKESGLLPVMGRLLKAFNFAYQPRSHACDLVQALHVVLRMLDRLNASEAGAFLVKQAARGGGPRPKKRKAAPAAASPTGAEGSPEPGQGPDASPGEKEKESSASPDKSGEAPVEGGRTGDPFEEAEQEEEQEERRRQVREVAYDLQRRLKQELAFPTVLHFYTWLLQGYATNPPFVNHCLAAFLRRIASSDGLDLEPMLYQLSVLRVFQAMLADKAWRKQKESGELVQLATHVSRNLFARLVPDLMDPGSAEEADSGSDNDEAEKRQRARKRLRVESQVKEKAASMMFIELMFWKPAPVAQLVKEEYNWRDMYDKQSRKERGYGSDADSDGVVGFGKARSAKSIMTDEQAEELKDIFEELNGWKDCLQRCVSGMGGSFSKAQISRQLNAMGLKKNRLTNAQEDKLRELYAQHSSEKGYLAVIAEELMGGFSKGQIGSQLRKLGLRPDKGKKRKSQGDQDSSDSGSGSSSDSDSEAESDASGREPTGSHSQHNEDTSPTANPDADQSLEDTAHRDPSIYPSGPNTDPADPDRAGQSPAAKQKKRKQYKKRRKQDDSSKKHKKQKQRKKKTAVTDWTSDDSSEGGPAAIPDQLNPMPDSDAEDDAAPASPISAAAGAEQSCDVKDSSHSKSADRHSSKSGKQNSKKRLPQTSGRQKASMKNKGKAAADWSSDDDSDAAPLLIPDALNSMPDPDGETAGGNDAQDAVTGGKQTGQHAKHSQQPAKRAKHAKHTAAQSGHLQSEDGPASPESPKKINGKKQQKNSSGAVQTHKTDEEKSGHKPRRRLRKAAPSEAAKPADSAAAVMAEDMADDIVVDLEDPRQMREEEADGQDRDGKRREGVRLVSNRQNVDEAEEAGAAPAGKPRKRLKKQSEPEAVSGLPSSARSALETLRLQRLQNQSLSDSAQPVSTDSAPVQDTLPQPSNQDNGSVPIWTQDTMPETSSLGYEDRQQSPPVHETLADSSDAALNHAASTADTLPDQAASPAASSLMDQSAGHAESAPIQDTLPGQVAGASQTWQNESAPMQDTLADRPEDMPDHQLQDSSSAEALQPNSQHDNQLSTQANANEPPVSDTLASSAAALGVEEGLDGGEDDELIWQALTGAADEDVADEDSELLQQLLDEQQH